MLFLDQHYYPPTISVATECVYGCEHPEEASPLALRNTENCNSI